MFYDTAKNDHGLPRDPFKAIVAPRPIGWITSMSAKGEINLAPYSFFNAVSDQPPIVLFSSEGPKDSLVFIEETKEFVCSLATFELRAAVVHTSAQFARGVNEMEQADLVPAPCRLVRPPRVAASPCALECKLCRSSISRIWKASHRTAMSCSDRWWASISTTASSRTAGSTPQRSSRSRVAATRIIPSSTGYLRSRDRPR
jgi:flavin reductase (DIM6/NTAB) family NADH-FMN oxidoreductase RutF